MVLTNKFDNVGRLFTGYFTISDGTVDYSFEQLVELSVGTTQITAPHYGTFGRKKLATVGYESTATVRVDDTADLYPTNDIMTGTPNAKDKVSISYFLDRATKNVLVPAIFSTTERFDADPAGGTATDIYIVHSYTGFITGSELVRNRGTGTYERVMDFDIIEVTKTRREATGKDTPADAAILDG